MSDEFFHATERRLLPKIMAQGLVDPYLTDDGEVANYYAETIRDEGQEPVVLVVRIPDPANLRPDDNAMCEPVIHHPTTVPNSDDTWQLTLSQVHSVRYEGTIPASHFALDS